MLFYGEMQLQIDPAEQIKRKKVSEETAKVAPSTNMTNATPPMHLIRPAVQVDVEDIHNQVEEKRGEHPEGVAVNTETHSEDMGNVVDTPLAEFRGTTGNTVKYESDTDITRLVNSGEKDPSLMMLGAKFEYVENVPEVVDKIADNVRRDEQDRIQNVVKEPQIVEQVKPAPEIVVAANKPKKKVVGQEKKIPEIVIVADKPKIKETEIINEKPQITEAIVEETVVEVKEPDKVTYNADAQEILISPKRTAKELNKKPKTERDFSPEHIAKFEEIELKSAKEEIKTEVKNETKISPEAIENEKLELAKLVNDGPGVVHLDEAINIMNLADDLLKHGKNEQAYYFLTATLEDIKNKIKKQGEENGQNVA